MVLHALVDAQMMEVLWYDVTHVAIHLASPVRLSCWQGDYPPTLIYQRAVRVRTSPAVCATTRRRRHTEKGRTRTHFIVNSAQRFGKWTDAQRLHKKRDGGADKDVDTQSIGVKYA